MKDEKAKYLILDANEIEKTLYELQRIFEFNDSWNNYCERGKVKAKEYFDNNNIPEEYQKIIIKITSPLLTGHEAEEFILGMAFDLTGKRVEKINNELYVNGVNCPIFYDNQGFYNFINFKTRIKKVRYNEIISFFKEIKKEGLLEGYINSLKEFFDISLKINYTFDDDNILDAIKEYKLKHPYGSTVRINHK